MHGPVWSRGGFGDCYARYKARYKAQMTAQANLNKTADRLSHT